MENKNTQATIHRFGRLETGTPIVIETFGPNQWINFGINNDFPQELIRLYQNASVLHTALIDRKVQMVAGNGILTQTPFVMNQYSKDTLNEIALKLAYDEVIFGGFYVNIIWDADGTTVQQVEHLPYEKMRIGKPDYDCNPNTAAKIQGFYMSRDWCRWRRLENKPMFMPDYYQDFTKEYEIMVDDVRVKRKITRQEFNQAYGSQVMFFRTYSVGMDYYTLPSYNPSLNDLKTDYEISVFHLKSLQNGLMPNMIISNKSGIPTAEERDEEYQRIVETLTGTENSGGFIMTYALDPERAPEFIPVQLNTSDQKFKDMKEQIDKSIMYVHKFTSALAGIETAGKLGTSAEITEGLTFIQSTVISPIQLKIQNSLNKIAKLSGSDETIELKKYVIFDDATVQASIEANSTIKKTIAFSLKDK